MKKLRIAAAAALAVAVVLTGCSPRSSMSTLSADSASSAESSVFSLTKVLDLGVNYLISLDYENAIQQYVEIIQHDPKNKDAFAGLYAAYTALGQTEKAQEIMTQAEETFGSVDPIMGKVLDDAALLMENGGGNAVYSGMADGYMSELDETNSPYLQQVAEAWLEKEPENPSAYAALGAAYACSGDDESAQKLMESAKEHGIEWNEIETDVETKTDGSYTLSLKIENVQKPDDKPVKVEVKPDDNAQKVVQKVTESVASSAAQEVVQQSGLEGEAASIANSMAQEAIQQGLSAMSVPGIDMSSFSLPN